MFVYPASADAYDVYAEIGAGAFATVYQGKVRATGVRHKHTHPQTADKLTEKNKRLHFSKLSSPHLCMVSSLTHALAHPNRLLDMFGLACLLCRHRRRLPSS